jgi:hypothetical protein
MLNDAWVDVLSFLDVQSIVWASVGLKPLLGDAARDNRLWKWLCQLHWQSKQPHPWSQTSASVEWHRIFQQAWQDSRRCAITEEELCRVCWMRQLGASRRQGFFLADGTYHNNKGVHSTSIPWKLRGTGQTLPVSVSLGRFPDLTVSRTPDWGWQLMNASARYASFVQGAADAASLPPPRYSRFMRAGEGDHGYYHTTSSFDPYAGGWLGDEDEGSDDCDEGTEF